MSDFVPRDILPELWEEILKIHWNYLETEESIVKLETRKRMEDCLKEFLCIVQPDRKFFLPETARVLKNSILELENFNAQKGITAFEAISQYANNLFTKPWRKEFRILKLYSGFYQHEITSNVIGAEILFEAMGYRRLSEDTLILDGPICPDQVSNVSRDAMIAYVELQIIKHIHSGLEAIGIKYSWLDIYQYREKNSGSTSQTVRAIGSSLEENHFCSRQKLFMKGDNYDYIDVQPSSNYFERNSTQFCPAECQCRIYKEAPSLSRQRQISRANGFCCVPEHQTPSLTTTNMIYNNMSYPSQQMAKAYQYNKQHHHSGMPTENGGALLSHMPHSRSLDHYNETQNHHLIPHRHSFDHQQHGCTAQHHYHNSQQHKMQQQSQQQPHYYQHVNKTQQHLYESPYDCVDGNSLGGGSSTISYAAIAANAGLANASIGTGSGCVGSNCSLNPNSTYSDPYNVSGNRFPLPLNISNQLFYEKSQSNNYNNDLPEPTYAHIRDQNIYSKLKLPQNFAKDSSIYNHPKDSLQRQHSCQSESLINFDDVAIRHQGDSLRQQYRSNYENSSHLMDKHFNVRNNRESPLAFADLSTNGHQPCGTGKLSTNDEVYVYAQPTPKEKRKENTINTRKYTISTGDTTDGSYDSATDDFTNLATTDSERNHQSSPTQSTKNQDGFGSAEVWSNVYQTVEKKGYSNDLGERNELLVQSLNLDSLNINNGTLGSQNSLTDKRRSLHTGNDKKTTLPKQLESKPKTKPIENTKCSSKNNSKTETVSNNTQKYKSSLENNTKKLKSAPKQTYATSKPNTNRYKSQSKSNDNKTSSKIVNNNNNNDFNVNEHKKGSSATDVNTTKKPTQIVISGANEWSCNFCTYLNPNTKRVCEICCHSKDFKNDSTAAGTTAMAHNTPTCA